jgi:hypothetical protein
MSMSDSPLGQVLGSASMDYRQRIAELSDRKLSSSFQVSSQRLRFRRPPLRAWTRAILTALFTGLCLLWATSNPAESSLIEYVLIAALAGFSVWLVRVALHGDTLVILEPSGLRTDSETIPWPTIHAVHINSKGALQISYDAGPSAGVLEILPRSLNLQPLLEAVEYVVYGSTPAS